MRGTVAGRIGCMHPCAFHFPGVPTTLVDLLATRCSWWSGDVASEAKAQRVQYEGGWRAQAVRAAAEALQWTCILLHRIAAWPFFFFFFFFFLLG